LSKDLLAQDLEARRAAQTEFVRPLVLEAGAGTGKTTTLVARLIAWTLGAGWELALELDQQEQPSPSRPREERTAAKTLEGIVAITFTEAAAAEMASRVSEGLAAVASGEETRIPGVDFSLFPTLVDAPVRAARAGHLLGHLDRLTIRTIHAYCRSLLLSHPLELGIQPDFRIDAEGHAIEEVVRSIVESHVKRAYSAADSSALLEVAARGLGPRSLAEALIRFALEGIPAKSLLVDPFSPERVDEARRELLAVIDSFHSLANDRLRKVTRGTKARRVDRALRNTASLLRKPSETGVALAQEISRGLDELWPDPALKALSAWAKGRYSKAEHDALDDRAAELSPLANRLRRRIRHLSSLDPAATNLMRRALAPLLEEVESALRGAGIATFNSLLLQSRTLLETRPEVLRRERHRIRQLLVDEFQDTDALQCRLVSLLALTGPRSERPGLFIVGDPKQSIYGWRNADLEAYEGFLERVTRAGGRIYPLVRNFRSAPAILAEVDRAVRPVMRRVRGLQPEFKELLPSDTTRSLSGFDRTPWSPLEYWVSWAAEAVQPEGIRTGADRAAEVEATAVALDIRRLHDQALVPWKEFGVLFRNTHRLEIFLEAFRRTGVPFAVTSDKHYYRRREIIEVAAFVRCIVNPADHIALLTFLRSALVGVPDSALMPLWRQDFPRRITELDDPDDETALAVLDEAVRKAVVELPRGIPGLDRIRGWEANLRAAVRILAALRRSFSQDPPDRFIERLRTISLLEASEAARFLGQYRVANVERFLRRLEAALEEKGGDVQAILRSLRRSISEAQEAQEALPKEAAEDAVQVMTIHKAKGLEFGHAYVVQLHAETRRTERERMDADRRWGPEGPEEYVLFGNSTLNFDRVEAARSKVAAAEQVRLLYVAMTRAQQRLVLVGNWPAEPIPRNPQASATFLDLLLNRDSLPPSLPQLAHQALDGPGFIDAAGVRWRFPGLEPAEGDMQTTEPPVSFPPRATIRRASEGLQVLGDRARLRMERGLIGQAAAEPSGGDVPESRRRGPEPIDRGKIAARAVGTALHAVLENWDLEADLEAEAERQRERLRLYLASRLSAHQLEAASRRADTQLSRIAGGGLLVTLVERREEILARELPVLLPAEGSTEGPLFGTSGIVDLLLRDPKNESYLVVDYKTDEVESEAALAARADHYRPQLVVYAEAVRQGLDLPRLPQTELWFLWADRRWRVS
jgi:ATP-dependent helicase/nuclease subunit A